MVRVAGITTPDEGSAGMKRTVLAALIALGAASCASRIRTDYYLIDAAIVSRELGVPCIIGTQVATKILKDGDMVEVDANHSRIIKL